MSRYYLVLARRSKRWSELRDSDKSKKSSMLKRFVRKGIPLNQRAPMWLMISGASVVRNELNITYHELKSKISNRTIIDMIEIDLPRTFPDNIFFSRDHSLPRQLFNVLATFAHQNSEIGYCQGLNYIAGLIILATKSEEASFWILKTLTEHILPKYYVRSMCGLLTDMAVLDELIKIREPAIHQHLHNIGMPWAVTTTKWFICIYAEVLPTETVFRIWDCLFYEGSKIIFRVALTLIKIHKEEILKTEDLAELVDCFKNMGNHPNVIDCHQFMIVSV